MELPPQLHPKPHVLSFLALAIQTPFDQDLPSGLHTMVYLSGRYYSPSLSYWVPAHSLALSWALFPSQVWPLWLDQSLWYILLEYLYLFVTPLFISGVFQIYRVIISASFFPTRAHTHTVLSCAQSPCPTGSPLYPASSISVAHIRPS